MSNKRKSPDEDLETKANNIVNARKNEVWRRYTRWLGDPRTKRNESDDECSSRRDALESLLASPRNTRSDPLWKVYKEALELSGPVLRPKRRMRIIEQDDKKAQRSFFARAFQAHCVLSPEEMCTVKSLSQGRPGPCSFAAYLTLCRLSDPQLTDADSATYISVENSATWLQYWDHMGPDGERPTKDTSADIAQTIDMMCSLRQHLSLILDRPAWESTVFKTLLPNLVYIPVKDRNTELCAHPIFSKNGKYSSSRIEIMFNVGALLETLIDLNIPVAVNFRQHSRVLVGYNDNELLFLDTQGDLQWDRQKEDRDDDSDLCVAGFSRVRGNCNKWNVYNEVRDICFFPWPRSRPTPTPVPRTPERATNRNIKRRRLRQIFDAFPNLRF